MSTPYESAQLILKLFEMRRETLLREARTGLASTLRDVVSRAVAQEIARHRGR